MLLGGVQLGLSPQSWDFYSEAHPSAVRASSDAVCPFPQMASPAETTALLTCRECAHCSFHVSLCSTSTTKLKRSL